MGRPTKALIEYDRVVEMAVAIIDEGHLNDLNMRVLGKRLGVHPSSLYHHFKDKDEILDAVCDYIARKVRPTRVAAATWKRTLVKLAKFYRSQIVAYPNASMLMFHRNQGETRLHYHALYEEVLQSLIRAGFSEERALVALMGTEMVALGSAFSEIISNNKFDFGAVSQELHPLLHQITQNKKITARSGFAEFFNLFLLGLAGESEQHLKAATRPARNPSRRSGKPKDEEPAPGRTRKRQARP